MSSGCGCTEHESRRRVEEDSGRVRRALGELANWASGVSLNPNTLWYSTEMATGPGQTEIVLALMRREPWNCARWYVQGDWLHAWFDPFNPVFEWITPQPWPHEEHRIRWGDE